MSTKKIKTFNPKITNNDSDIKKTLGIINSLLFTFIILFVVVGLINLLTYSYKMTNPVKTVSEITSSVIPEPTQTPTTVQKDEAYVNNDNVLKLINLYRQKNGLNILEKSVELCTLAEKRVSYLV